MGCNFEAVAGVIRAGKDFEKFGDDFEFSATAVILDREVYIKGASGKFSKRLFDELKVMFKNMGMLEVHWERVKENRIKTLVVKL